MSNPRLLDRKGLADHLGVSPDAVDKMRREGLIDYVPGFKPKRYDKKVIDKWLDGLSGLSNPEQNDRWLGRIGGGQDAA